MTLTSSDITSIVKGRLTGSPVLTMTDIITDSRHLSFTEDLAFFAIKGQNHNGHHFIENLYRKGIRIFVTEELPDKPQQYKDAAFIVTENTILALQDLAAYKRSIFRSPVIAITGSAGKTIVKEWLADIAGMEMSVVRSPRSYNSQIGVPLSVWKLDAKYRLGIFEAGISFPGEMEKLKRIIEPDTGIFTNIGDAHNENFTGMEDKLREKLRLFHDVSRIIYCRDHTLVNKLITSDPHLRTKELTDWSCSDANAAIYVKITPDTSGRTNAEMRWKGKTVNFIIPFIDRASVENALTVASACMVLGIKTETISRGLSGLVPVAMRMEIKSGVNNCQLIEDYYNSDPGSLGMALDYLRGQKSRKATLILSDFIQSGRDEKELYSDVAALIRRAGIDKFIGIGEALSRNSALFGQGARFFYSTEEFLLKINTAEFISETILIKGARIFEFENIGKYLGIQVHQTLLEVNLDAIAHNLSEFRRHLAPETRIMAMVKAFAYGAGPAEIAGLLEYHRVSSLGVAYTDEGVELRNAGVTLPVMVMNPDLYSPDIMIRHNLEPVIYSFHSLEKFSGAASRHGLINYPVHIETDTGMHRLGFMPDDISGLSSRLKDLDTLRVVSVFSHFAASEDPSLDAFTHRQAELFIHAASIIREAVGYSFMRHICNSSAIIRFPQYHFEMVRPGIGIYGSGVFPGLSLKPAGRFKTKITQLKKIPAGDPVGYGCSDVSDRERTIAILPVGYADGLNRKLGNRRGELFINNFRVPVTGNICMDMCMADVSCIKAAVGDEAEIFGDNISIEEIAEKCGTIPYEILTSIPARVRRVFFRE